jgi:Spy/CpxP family protein refolding chaperone
MEVFMKIIQTKIGIGSLFAGCLAMVSLLSPASAQYDAMSQARTVATFGLMSPRLLNALNLTPEQKAQIERSKDAFREAQRAYLREITPLRKEVADKLFGPGPVREADVAAQITKIADLREKILSQGFRIALEVRSVLRPDQLAKAAAIRQQLQDIQSEVQQLYSETP